MKERLRQDQGDYVGRKRIEVYDEEVQRQIREKGKDFALPGGESMNQVGKRGLDWLRAQERLVDASRGGTRLVFDGEEWHVDTFAQPIQDIQ